MPDPEFIQPQVLIVGGGAAGLWIANELNAAGVTVVVVESDALGTGQTIGSQGILHGGTKYALSRFFDRSAYAIRDMPDLWRRCLAGSPPEGRPDLSDVRVRADFCHLWRTDTGSSRFAQLGARLFLRTAPNRLTKCQWPAPLKQCPGDVFELPEQVISPATLLKSLSIQLGPRIVHGIVDSVEPSSTGAATQRVIVESPDKDRSLTIEPQYVVLSAGSGNTSLRNAFGLATDVMQLRPLHMVMLRGSTDGLPELNGHCVDGRATRMTITTDCDSAGRTVWQVGGQVAERGVTMRELELIRFARDELTAVLPGVDLSRAEWATYTATRAEGRTTLGRRPEGPVAARDGNVITCWPTKLVLVPELASMVRSMLDLQPADSSDMNDRLSNWPQPAVAAPPWETALSWTRIP